MERCDSLHAMTPHSVRQEQRCQQRVAWSWSGAAAGQRARAQKAQHTHTHTPDHKDCAEAHHRKLMRELADDCEAAGLDRCMHGSQHQLAAVQSLEWRAGHLEQDMSTEPSAYCSRSRQRARLPDGQGCRHVRPAARTHEQHQAAGHRQERTCPQRRRRLWWGRGDATVSELPLRPRAVREARRCEQRVGLTSACCTKGRREKKQQAPLHQ